MLEALSTFLEMFLWPWMTVFLLSGILLALAVEHFYPGSVMLESGIVVASLAVGLLVELMQMPNAKK